jgi:hypothetical protein
MPSNRVLFGLLACILTVPAMAATAPDDCAPMVRLLHQARTDFPSLRQEKMDPGKCSLRQTEYRCAWHFPGDRFELADAQASRLLQCVAGYPAAQPAKVKRGDSAFAVDPDLTIMVPRPELDGDGWNVLLTIRSSYKPQ